MSPLQHSLVCAALLFAAATPALAAGSSASSASESVGQSIGSSSTSIQKSSDGSSKATRVAQGDYRVIDMAELAGQPGMLRVHLQAEAGDAAGNDFFLLLPRQAAEQGRLAQGKTVTASTRPYGTQFAAADTKQAFFLVLDDEWRRELDTRAVL